MNSSLSVELHTLPRAPSSPRHQCWCKSWWDERCVSFFGAGLLQSLTQVPRGLICRILIPKTPQGWGPATGNPQRLHVQKETADTRETPVPPVSEQIARRRKDNANLEAGELQPGVTDPGLGKRPQHHRIPGWTTRIVWCKLRCVWKDTRDNHSRSSLRGRENKYR